MLEMPVKLAVRRLILNRRNHAEPELELTSASSSYASDDTSFKSEDDPYSDVRERMEALSAADKERYLEYYESSSQAKNPFLHETQISWFTAYTCYLCYAVLLFLGHLRDFCSDWFKLGRYYVAVSKQFAPLLSKWERLYTRRVYNRLQDCFNRPICSAAGCKIDILERVSTDRYKSLDVLGKLPEELREDYQGEHFTKDGPALARRCLNLGSYNYLGFADDWRETCAKDVHGCLEQFPISSASSCREYGYTVLHKKVEETVAEFLGKEDALMLNMGYNTNATTIPALVGKEDLILSDELNHTSIVSGARASGAAIRVFKHNNSKHLEEVLRQAIVMGRPRTRRPFGKILIIVEGVYSMEGEYCDLKNIVRIAKKYGAYVYLDEAHSIGAMGPSGRGCSEYCGVDTADIDIMMGTFSKSFAGVGGYIAGDRQLISYLRRKCAGSALHNAPSPVVCRQVLTAFNVIMGKDGTCIGRQKIQALRDNSNYFRMRLQEMGLEVLGQYDSPVIPVMLYHIPKIALFSRECLKRGVAVVVVGAPAVPLLECRARFCMSAAHTREDLDRALEQIEEIVDIVNIRHSK